MGYRIKALFEADAELTYEHKGEGVSVQIWTAGVSGWYKFEVGIYTINCQQEISVALIHDHPEWGCGNIAGDSGITLNDAIENFISEANRLKGDDWNAAMTALGMYVRKA